MNYFSNIFRTVGSMVSGMKLTGHYFINPKKRVTEQYPDNRATLKLSDRFKGEVSLTHTDENHHPYFF
jgi:NADH-quinone oxidoreductase subunit I